MHLTVTSICIINPHCEISQTQGAAQIEEFSMLNCSHLFMVMDELLFL